MSADERHCVLKAVGLRGQTWSIDFIVSLMLFVTAALLAVRIVLTITSGSNFEDVRVDATDLSTAVMSEGIPRNWTQEAPNRVIAPGILTDGQLNITKWAAFAAMNISRNKLMMGIDNDYVISITPLNASLPSPVVPCLAGVNDSNATGCGANFTFPEGADVVRIDRVVAYNGSILSVRMFVWS